MSRAGDGQELWAAWAIELPAFCGIYISVTTGPIDTNSIFCFSSVGQVIGCPWATLGAHWAKVLSVLAVAQMRDHASLLLGRVSLDEPTEKQRHCHNICPMVV